MIVTMTAKSEAVCERDAHMPPTPPTGDDTAGANEDEEQRPTNSATGARRVR